MNLPNKLTMMRIILIPFFVFFALASFVPYNMYIALGIFVIASLTDMLDGKIARKRNLVTNFGKFADPVADKLLVITALLCLLIIDGGKRICDSQILALLGVWIIVLRELIIEGFRLVACESGLVLAASIWGKLKTATTMVTICLMLVVTEISKLFPYFKEITLVLFWISVTLTVVSLVDYLAKNSFVLADAFDSKKGKKDEEDNSVSSPEISVASPQNDFAPKFDSETGEPLQ